MVAASSTFLRSSPHFFGQTIEIHAPSSAAPACLRFRSPSFSATYTSTKRTSSPFQSSKMASTTISLYEVLGIPMGATCQEIKSAYRKLARVCHPDVVAIDRKDTSADEFKKIHAAYSTLSDPAKRADYDQKLFKRHRSFSSPFSTSASSSMSSTMSGFSGYTRRTWETDQCW